MATKHKKHADGGGDPKKQRRGLHAPTVAEIISDYLTQLSLEYWAPRTADFTLPKKDFEAKVIDEIYEKELAQVNTQRVMMLELSHYLENYLWPNFNSKSNFQHVMSIIIMVNEKFRENVQAWDCFHTREDVFPEFFARVLALNTDHKMTIHEKVYYILFLVNCFQSFEDQMVRQQTIKLVSYHLWFNMSEGRLAQELKPQPKLKRHFEALKKKEAEGQGPTGVQYERTFMPSLIKGFFDILNSIPTDGSQVNQKSILYIERFTELMIDLEAQLPTRRYFHAYLSDIHFQVRCRLSPVIKLPKAKLWVQLLDILKFYEGFEINNVTGNSLTDTEMSATHSDRIQALQRLAFKHFPELRELALANIASIDTKAALLRHLKELKDDRLHELCVLLNLIPTAQEREEKTKKGLLVPPNNREFLENIVVAAHERRLSQRDAINEMSFYPNETILWDENVVPSEHYTGETCLALPKLNLQFLTFHDYLLRNFNLFKLESTYEIRDNIEDCTKRVNGRRDYDGNTHFQGWSRMALPVKSFSVANVAKPNIGENRPAQVISEATYTLVSTRGNIRTEWENIRQHDIVFLLAILPEARPDESLNPDLPFPKRYGIKYIRGAEVLEIADESGVVLKDMELDQGKRREGNVRTMRLLLDPSQYQTDVVSGQSNTIYSSINLIMRRKPKENNFKAVLETIRDLMNTRCVVPDWLHDVFLGYGQPDQSTTLEEVPTINFNDTFLDIDHLRASFPGRKFTYKNDNPLVRPFKVGFPPTPDAPLVVEAYVPPNPGPYPQDIPKKNAVPFTHVQVEAIRSGINSGLTLVVGPPGTGKTDVAVQIISNLYHTFPEQRTLFVTHSNTALNHLFEKIMALDVNERHLLRLGHGQEMLETDKDFSKWGRVNYMLGLRVQQLAEVERLAASLKVAGDVGYTCETAAHFYLFHVLARWEEFKAKIKETTDPAAISQNFPFLLFFETAPQPLFKFASYAEDLEIAEGCFRHIKKIFTELEECRAFELLKGGADRSNYLLTKQAKIIAMTCTHAALKRGDMVDLGFKYDNLLMEESAQILEIETFIPMLLQNTEEKEGSRLKRVILIGDHNQLPPIVKNMAFQKYSHLDQSLFARFVRLGVPTIDLDMQGRARPSIAELYNWRYKKLGNLPNVLHEPEFLHANAGFVHDYQLIDVQDYEGRGESEPNPYFYQNLGEAEFVVATFMYMRLLGYPAHKISIITTYNGQKNLIRDVIQQRCANNPRFGSPAKVTTVDKFQGQQNDYILLSLVRTKTVGHLRDVRRLVVAMSRARLGLYVFCRKSLFENCYELTPAFSKLLQRPIQLQLVQNEMHPTTRTLGMPVTTPFPVADVTHLIALVNQNR
eukprot:Phypoly_transcript_00743.p1 GENE.Phypoly_transcript_00743~~Phypoly_transcript_00743.p1  ORF type:complete len:1358 (+),score=249.61 Phypoly_transcript_00743:43-4116(+)